MQTQSVAAILLGLTALLSPKQGIAQTQGQAEAIRGGAERPKAIRHLQRRRFDVRNPLLS